MPVPTFIDPLAAPAPLSIETCPDPELALEPDDTITDPPRPEPLSPTLFPASKLNDPPMFALDPLSMDMEPPANSPDPDDTAALPPDPVLDEPDPANISPPSPEVEAPPDTIMEPPNPDSEDPA